MNKNPESQILFFLQEKKWWNQVILQIHVEISPQKKCSLWLENRPSETLKKMISKVAWQQPSRENLVVSHFVGCLGSFEDMFLLKSGDKGEPFLPCFCKNWRHGWKNLRFVLPCGEKAHHEVDVGKVIYVFFLRSRCYPQKDFSCHLKKKWLEDDPASPFLGGYVSFQGSSMAYDNKQFSGFVSNRLIEMYRCTSVHWFLELSNSGFLMVQSRMFSKQLDICIYLFSTCFSDYQVSLGVDRNEIPLLPKTVENSGKWRDIWIWNATTIEDTSIFHCFPWLWEEGYRGNVSSFILSRLSLRYEAFRAGWATTEIWGTCRSESWDAIVQWERLLKQQIYYN